MEEISLLTKFCKVCTIFHLEENCRPLIGLSNKFQDFTHVVSTVTYGMGANFKLTRRFKREESQQEISGSLHVLVKSIPAFSIEGKASINITGKLLVIFLTTLAVFKFILDYFQPVLNSLDQSLPTHKLQNGLKYCML